MAPQYSNNNYYYQHPGYNNYPYRNISTQDYEYMTSIRVQRDAKRKAKTRVCTNCHTTRTPSWRRSKESKQLLCNACGLYAKLHGKDRPFAKAHDGRTKALKHVSHKYICLNCQVSGLNYFGQDKDGFLHCTGCGDYEYNTKMYHQQAANSNYNYYYQMGEYRNMYPEQQGQ